MLNKRKSSANTKRKSGEYQYQKGPKAKKLDEAPQPENESTLNGNAPSSVTLSTNPSNQALQCNTLLQDPSPKVSFPQDAGTSAASNAASYNQTSDTEISNEIQTDEDDSS